MEESRITELEKENLEEALIILESANRSYNLVSDFIQEKYTELQKSLEAQIVKKKELEERITNIRNSIRNKALEIYMRDKEQGKGIHAGIKERDVVELVYEDETAIQWCMEHGIFLQLGRSSFEKFLRNLDERDLPKFVQRSIKATITLPYTSIKDENNG